jgi:hypothetical protein
MDIKGSGSSAATSAAAAACDDDMVWSAKPKWEPGTYTWSSSSSSSSSSPSIKVPLLTAEQVSEKAREYSRPSKKAVASFEMDEYDNETIETLMPRPSWPYQKECTDADMKWPPALPKEHWAKQDKNDPLLTFINKIQVILPGIKAPDDYVPLEQNNLLRMTGPWNRDAVQLVLEAVRSDYLAFTHVYGPKWARAAIIMSMGFRVTISNQVFIDNVIIPAEIKCNIAQPKTPDEQTDQKNAQPTLSAPLAMVDEKDGDGCGSSSSSSSVIGRKKRKRFAAAAEYADKMSDANDADEPVEDQADDDNSQTGDQPIAKRLRKRR